MSADMDRPMTLKRPPKPAADDRVDPIVPGLPFGPRGVRILREVAELAGRPPVLRGAFRTDATVTFVLVTGS